MRRSLLSILATGVVVMASSLVFDSPAQAACTIWADEPDRMATADGGRSGCTTTTTITVKVCKDVSFLPDPCPGVSSRSGFTNGSLWAVGGCSNGYGTYYTVVTTSNGGKAESDRVSSCY
jgi:hypothetical protein